MMANWDCAVHVCSAFPSLMLPDCIVEVEVYSKVLSLLALRPVLLKRVHEGLACWQCLVNKLNGPPIGSLLAQCWNSRGKVSRSKSLQKIHQTLLLTLSALFNISLRPAQHSHSNVEVQITQRGVRKEQISKGGVLR